MSMKRKDLMKTAGADAAWGKQKWGTKFRMRASLTHEMVPHDLLKVKLDIWINTWIGCKLTRLAVSEPKATTPGGIPMAGGLVGRGCGVDRRRNPGDRR